MAARTKVAHLTSVHQPVDTRIFHKECKTLAAAGYEVVLVVPCGSDECGDGVRLRTVPTARNRWERMSRTVWQVYRAALNEKADIYHFHDPELIPVGLILKLRRRRVIYDAHEHVPNQVLSKSWIPASLRIIVGKAVGAVEMLGARFFDGIIVANPSTANRFPQQKTVAVQNFPILNELVMADPPPFANRPNNVAFVGAISVTRSGREMVQAMAELPKAIEARLLLAGKYHPPSLEGELRQLPAAERTDFLGWQSRQEVAELLGRSRVGLALVLDANEHSANLAEAQPTKLFEYMAAGVPVIASDFPLWRTFVDGAECGLLVADVTPKSIATAVRWLLEHPEEAETMGMRGREAVRKHYNWDGEAKVLLDFYRTKLGLAP